MGRYRKIDPRIHNDAKFKALSERGKLLFFTILTHPHMTALGAMRATEAGLCEEMALGASVKDAGCPADCAAGCPSGCAADRVAGVFEGYRQAFRDLIEKGLIKFDPASACLVIPKFLKYNPPESPSVVKAWNAAGDLIPECDLRDELIENTIKFLQGYGNPDKDSYLKAFTLRPLKKKTAWQSGGQSEGQTDQQATGQGGAHQEQEPEQEQEQEQGKDISPSSPSSISKKKKKTPLPKNFEISDAVRKWAEENGYRDLEKHLEAFVDYVKSSGKQYVDWDAALRKAIREDWGKVRAGTRRNGDRPAW
jgi:hypothetical protein